MGTDIANKPLINIMPSTPMSLRVAVATKLYCNGLKDLLHFSTICFNSHFVGKTYISPLAPFSSCIQSRQKVKQKVYGYSSLQCNIATPLWELIYHIGSHSVTCHLTEVTHTHARTHARTHAHTHTTV